MLYGTSKSKFIFSEYNDITSKVKCNFLFTFNVTFLFPSAIFLILRIKLNVIHENTSLVLVNTMLYTLKNSFCKFYTTLNQTVFFFWGGGTWYNSI